MTELGSGGRADHPWTGHSRTVRAVGEQAKPNQTRPEHSDSPDESKDFQSQPFPGNTSEEVGILEGFAQFLKVRAFCKIAETRVGSGWHGPLKWIGRLNPTQAWLSLEVGAS